MQKLKEARLIAKKLRQYKNQKKNSALLTVIRKKGSAYRSEGAKFLICEDGSQICGISGGCLEKGLTHLALKVIKSQEPIIEYADLQDKETWGLWLGCPGEVEILIEPVKYDKVLNKWIELVLEGKKFVYVKNISTLESAIYTKDEFLGFPIGNQEIIEDMLKNINENSKLVGNIFYDTLLVYPPIVFFGKGEELYYVQKFADILDFKVVNFDSIQDFEIPENSFVIIANHHIKLDRLSLKKALKSKASYIGLISSLKRFEKVAENLEVDQRVHVPAGINIGGEYPDEVVFSILSEIIAEFNKKTGQSLNKIKGLNYTHGGII